MMGLCYGKSSSPIASDQKKDNTEAEIVESTGDLQSIVEENLLRTRMSTISPTAELSIIKPNTEFYSTASNEKIMESVSYVNENDGIELIDID